MIKKHRFYDKSFKDPCQRWAIYWQLPEYFVRHIQKLIFLGLKDIHIRIFIKQDKDKDISRKSFNRFKEACENYYRIKQAGIKSGTLVGETFFENKGFFA